MPSTPASPADAARARALVLAHGWNAVAYQILNPGIAHWFATAGDAVVGHVTHAGTRVVAGAPVCAADRLAAVAAEFAADAHRAGERVVYFGAGERLERLFVAPAPGAGRHALVPLGAQPWWEPAAWEATVRAHRSLGAQLRRARNKGVAVEEWPGERAAADAGLRAVLARWLAGRGLPPLHFLVEPDTLGALADRRVLVARRAGAVVAFLVATPIPARRAWLLEQWPRVPGAPNGTVELLVDAAMRALAAAGADGVTMGLAPLSRHAPAAAAGCAPPPAWLRLALRWVRAHGRRFYDFDGLDAFKAKFRPARWEPIHAIAEGGRFPPRALWAIAAAFSRGSPVALVARAVAGAARAEAGRAIAAAAAAATARARRPGAAPAGAPLASGSAPTAGPPVPDRTDRTPGAPSP